MKAKIVAALALAVSAPAFAAGEVAGTPECDAAAERYADSRHPWKYSSQWFNYYTYYQNEGCNGAPL